jgi:Ca-activated chloride channel family protein
MKIQTSLTLGGLVVVALSSACVLAAGSKSSVSETGSDAPETAAAAPLPEGDNTKNKLIDWSLHPGNEWMYNGGDGYFYCYINLKSGESREQKKRTPLNISLVLDRSGSMSGDKIEYAKKAAKFVIEQLGNDDILSIVNYDDRIEVTSASQPVKNKEVLMRAIDKLTARGSTNLTGGMLEGYAQVNHTRRDGYVNRVLLLTDGLANVGITEPASIKKLVEKEYQQHGVALSTFGLGADYNEELLTMLAETGSANYYYISEADKIPDIFARELKGLLSVVAQNATVSVSVPPGWHCEKVYGYPYEVNDGKVLVHFNDVYANDEKAILVKFRMPRPSSEQVTLHGELSYVDAQSFDKVNEHKQAKISVTSDPKLVARSKDSTVEEMIALFESNERFEELMADVDKGDYTTARAKASAAVKELQTKQLTYKSAKLKTQEDRINTYLGDMDKVETMREEEKKSYQKFNKSYNYEIRKMKK